MKRSSAFRQELLFADTMKTFTITDTKNFNVRDTLECGQIFRYKQLGENSFGVYSQDKYAVLTTEGDTVTVQSDDCEYFADFFDLQTDYAEKVQRIKGYGSVMNKCAEMGKGIRILNQNLYEMIICFIISANNNIKRIQLIVERLCSAIGSPTAYGNAFPTAEQMAEKDETFYSSIGAGYRAKYLAETSKHLVNYNFDALCKMSTQDARKELLTFLGVGPKVADCILLFGMHRGDVFPVDTWIKKVYHAYFEHGHKDGEISSFFCNLFGEDAGLCQQYLFYCQRKYGQID